MSFIGTDNSTTILNKSTISTFFNNLASSPHIVKNNISLVYGEQLRDTQAFPIPLVVFYLDKATFSDNLFDTNYRDSDPFTSFIWGIKQRARFEVWADSKLTNATFVDHADSCWFTLSNVLQALYWQRTNGIKYKPLSFGFSVNSKYQFTRLGQSLILDVELTFPITYSAPVYEEINEIQITIETNEGLNG